ncbi:MAG: SOS response-associated peptidase family protein [Sphingomonadales bacterium]|nr:SOS response-associated peptidase family protein [Sphingomonadales bacterium]
MTMLYRLAADAAVIAVRFGAAGGNDPWSGGTIAPGQFAPVITAGREFVAGPRREGQPRRIVPRQWGVPPPPAAGESGRGVLTVRNPDSPFWIGNLRNSEFRCLVPTTAVMEWGRTDPVTGKRRAHWFACADQPLFALAGVWKDSEVPSFALLTCGANAAFRHAGRDAMPVILPNDPDAWHVWLHADWKRAAEMLAPYPSSCMNDAVS